MKIKSITLHTITITNEEVDKLIKRYVTNKTGYKVEEIRKNNSGYLVVAKEGGIPVEPPSVKELSLGTLKEKLFSPIESLDMDTRAYNGLKAAGFNRVIEILLYDPQGFLRFRNFGKKSLAEVEYVIENLELGDATDRIYEMARETLFLGETLNKEIREFSIKLKEAFPQQKRDFYKLSIPIFFSEGFWNGSSVWWENQNKEKKS